MRLRPTVTPTVGALCPFGKARFTSPAIDNASAFGKFAYGTNCDIAPYPLEFRLRRISGRGAEAPRAAGLVRHQTSGGGSKCGISQLHARVIRSYAQIMSNAHARRQLLSDHGPGGMHGSRPRPASMQPPKIGRAHV